MKMGINVIVGNMERTMQCPFLDIFGERNEEMMDLMYMRRMYPKEMSRIQSVIDDTCDRMEYDGSMMYDEYPDRVMVTKLCRNICDKIDREFNKDGKISNMRDIVQVMLCNEMCRRRSKRRNEKRRMTDTGTRNFW